MADKSRANKDCINSTALKSSTGCIKTMLRVSCIVLAFFSIIGACVVLGELDFPSLEERYANALPFHEYITIFSDRVESTRGSTWATGICLAIISFIAVILEITLLVISFFGCAASSTTLLLIVDIISGVVCALFFFAVSVPMDIYNGKWTEINGIIEYAFQALPNLIPTGYVEGPSAAKDLFNLDQLIPASGTAAVFGFLSTFAFIALVVASIIVIFTSRNQSTSTRDKPV